MLVVADMDVSLNSKAFVDRLPMMDRNKYDMFLHLGDFAYDIQTFKNTVGDDFFDSMSSRISREIPYVITPGNHEWYDFGNLLNFRFRMPGSGDFHSQSNHYFSFDYKGVHYISINWDYPFFMKPKERSAVFEWLKNDLIQSHMNPSINFKVFMSHRPNYCPEADGDHCKVFYHLKPYEDLMTKYGVDLYLNGHTHEYFRLKPQMNFDIHTG